VLFQSAMRRRRL